jgi:general L-amino acid transport system permease protein
MSELNSPHNRAFVRTNHLPQLSPPVSTSGAIGWARENLFSSPLNTALTLGSIYFLYLIVPPFFDWAFVTSGWFGSSNKDCSGLEGACWAVVTARFGQFIYGFYPEAERWRPTLVVLLFAANLLPILWDRVPGRSMAALSIVTLFPVVAYFLLHGGFGLVEVPTAKWGGFMLNMVLASVAIIYSLPLGILLALGRRSELPLIRRFCVLFIEFWRGVPLISVLVMASFMLPFFLPDGVNFNELLRAMVGLTLFSSAYMAEVVRGGLQAMPKGQTEAARGMGLTYWQSMRLIILPQALTITIPAIVNTFIGLFKDTSLVIVIGLFDILQVAKSSVTDPHWLGLEHEAYIFVALVFFCSCFGMSRYSLWLERKLDTSRRD